MQQIMVDLCSPNATVKYKINQIFPTRLFPALSGVYLETINNSHLEDNIHSVWLKTGFFSILHNVVNYFWWESHNLSTGLFKP